jgi:hypothetical protein
MLLSYVTHFDIIHPIILFPSPYLPRPLSSPAITFMIHLSSYLSHAQAHIRPYLDSTYERKHVMFVFLNLA